MAGRTGGYPQEVSPCGGRSWIIYKLGMDVDLQCLGCGQRIKLARRKFGRAVARELADRSTEGVGF
jgi:hypothetical protein